jgi:cellulose synthase/poly-beta-1,6-N-acetylglucosamine synthase-like glycosyltransferase
MVSATILVLLALLGLYLTIYVLYQAILFAANALIPDPPPFKPVRFRRFNVLIPAHNEERHVSRLLASVASQDYPGDRYRCTVIADNCTDGTVAACSGLDVDVLERHSANRGKGHAIRWALEQIPLDKFDALVIVDGDSVIAEQFLRQLNLQMERGDCVIQCYNAVGNPGQTWFTRLMDVSRTIANEIIHPGKRKLNLSSHLMGNGMCFDVRVLRTIGWSALSVGEDWEYYAQLVRRGVQVGYSKGARVYHEESVNLRQASSQRMRWSSGRFAVLKRYGLALFLHGLRTSDVRCLDAALPLLLPNPSLGINLTLLGLAAGALMLLVGGAPTMAVWFTVLTLAQLAMLIVGVLHTQEKMASAASLVLAPLFLVWKMGIDVMSMFGIGGREWKHTHRRVP